MRRYVSLLLLILVGVCPAATSGAEVVRPEDDASRLSGATGDVFLTSMLQEWSEERSVPDAGYDTLDDVGFGCDSCCDVGCDSCCTSGCRRWTLALDALFLKRSDAKDGRKEKTLNDAVDFDTDTGWRLTASHCLKSGRDIEFSYLSFDTVGASPFWGQGEQYTIVVVRPVYESDGTLRWVQEARSINTPARRRYASDLDSAEINLRHSLDGCTDLLAGVRWIQLDENLVDHDTSSAYAGMGTENDLWGFQLGVESLLAKQCNGCLEWRAGLKAGLYTNHTAQQMTEPYSFSHGSDNETAFCGELTLTGAYRMTDDLSFRVGYQMLWLAGVAVASDQPPLGLIDGPGDRFPVDADGDLFYHGALVGLEYRH